MRNVFGPRGAEIPLRVDQVDDRTHPRRRGSDERGGGGRGPARRLHSPDPSTSRSRTRAVRWPVPPRRAPGNPRHVLSNTLGFGGSNCSVVMELADDSGVSERARPIPCASTDVKRRDRMTGSSPGRYDIEAIKRRLPHRYPFLMVDRIEESGPGYAIGVKNVTANEPCFQGHFPQRSVLPGALIAEALMQTSAFVGRSAGADGASGAPRGRRRERSRSAALLHRPEPEVPQAGGAGRPVAHWICASSGWRGTCCGSRRTRGPRPGVVASGDLSLAVIAPEEDET